jgi:hypothetical protein
VKHQKIGRNWAVFHKKTHNTTFGIYRWEKPGRAGIVFRVGELGHVQLMNYRNKIVGGEAGKTRRRRHGVCVHWWGVRGRHLKRGIDIGGIF